MCPRVTDGQTLSIGWLAGRSHDGCVTHVELNRHSENDGLSRFALSHSAYRLRPVEWQIVRGI